MAERCMCLCMCVSLLYAILELVTKKQLTLSAEDLFHHTGVVVVGRDFGGGQRVSAGGLTEGRPNTRSL